LGRRVVNAILFVIIISILFIAGGGLVFLTADNISLPHTFAAGSPALASEVNENFQVLADKANSLDSSVTSLESTVATLQAGGSYWTKSGSNIYYNDGNVGIGTASPAVKLHVETSGTNDGIRATATGGSIEMYHGAARGVFQTTGEKDIQFRTNSAQDMMYFDHSTGYVGIATTSPDSELEVNGDILIYGSTPILQLQPQGSSMQNRIYFANETGVIDGAIWYTPSDDTMKFATNTIGSWDMIINSSGFVGLGDINPGVKFDIDQGDGRVDSGYSWLTNSDIRYKKDISPLTNALSKVSNIQGVRFNTLKENTDGTVGRHIGVIAQDVESVFPELVVKDSTGMKAVAYDKLTAVLIEAVKELKVENDQLRSRIEAIEGR